MIVGRKIKIGIRILLIVVVVVGSWFSIINLMRSPSERFGIYLLKNNEIVISDEDIVWYDGNTYEIKLTDEGIKGIQALKVGVYGEPFVIKINGEEIYNGSFWTPISSIPYHGIVIEIPFNTNSTTIKLEKGYPLEYFQGARPQR